MKREDYFNESTIVKNEIFDSLKDLLICSLCNQIFFEPKMCMICQNSFCKNCIEKWSQNEKNCPNGCENPEYHDSKEKNNLLSKITFNCINNCGKQMKYNELKNHYENECEKKGGNNNNNQNENEVEINSKMKFEILTKDEIEKLRQEGNEVNYITSKSLYKIIFIIINKIKKIIFILII